MAINSVSSDVVDALVQKLWSRTIEHCDHIMDGDLLTDDMDALADIIRSIPSNVEEPETIWIY